MATTIQIPANIQQQGFFEKSHLTDQIEAEKKSQRDAKQIAIDIFHDVVNMAIGCAATTYLFTAMPMSSAVVTALFMTLLGHITLAALQGLGVDPQNTRVPIAIISFVATKALAPFVLASMGLPALGLGYLGLFGYCVLWGIGGIIASIPTSAILDNLGLPATKLTPEQHEQIWGTPKEENKS